jgi:putative transposase
LTAGICFDGWYSGLENLKAVRGHGWHWLTRLKHNRLVDPDGSGNVAVSDLDLPAGGGRVHLMGYGFILVFRLATCHGGTEQVEHWATSDLSLTETQRQELSRQCFAIENYHRALKQCCGVERAQVRKAEAQKCHILLSLRAYVCLEANRLKTGLSGYAAKAEVVREAIRQYLRRPTIQLEPTA